MKKIIILGALAFIAVSVWSVGSSLSSDALSMATGILFGILAGLPTALLVLASNRRDDYDSRPRRGFGPSHEQESQRELHALRSENIRLQAALQAQQLPRPTAARLRVVSEWEQ